MDVPPVVGDVRDVLHRVVRVVLAAVMDVQEVVLQVVEDAERVVLDVREPVGKPVV